MELLKKDTDGVTVHFGRDELRKIAALIYAATVDFDKLDDQLHHLKKEEANSIDDDFSSLR